MTRSEAKTSALAGDVAPREVWSWAMFDFANSGYTTVVITAALFALAGLTILFGVDPRRGRRAALEREG